MSHLPLGSRIIIATHNAGKLREMTELLAPYGLSTISAGALNLPEPAETGMMFAENAAIKAHSAAKIAGLPALADDSGLCVDALDGAPGIFTADWAGPNRDYAGAFHRLAHELAIRDVEPVGAKAHFVSALVLAWPGGETLVAEGRVYGTLTFPARGPAGFGYDPIFVPDGDKRSFGEITAEEKHGIRTENGAQTGLSHRARAFIRLVALLGLEQGTS